MLLVFAREEDPVVAEFSRYAGAEGLDVWQPNRLDDVGWTYDVGVSSPSLEIVDRVAGVSLRPGDLAGIWWQSLPAPRRAAAGDERQHGYVAAEVASSLRGLWLAAPCPVVGQSRADFDGDCLGVDSRLELRRRGFAVLDDWVGTLSTLSSCVPGTDPDVLWTTRTGERSGWLSELEQADEEPVSATPLDDRCVRAVVHVDAETFVVQSDGVDVRRLSPATPDIVDAGQAIAATFGARVGVAYFARQRGVWALARYSLQIPYWLNDLIAAWLHPRLLGVFAAAIPQGARPAAPVP